MGSIWLVILCLVILAVGCFYLWWDYMRIDRNELALACGFIGMSALTCAVVLRMT